MHLIFQYPGVSVVLLSWIVGGIYSIWRDSDGRVGVAVIVTVLWGLYHFAVFVK